MPVQNALQGRHFLVTWSQVGETPFEELREFLSAIPNREAFTIAEELHADGNRHFHSYFLFDKRVKINPAVKFNFNEIHPNIQLVRGQVRGKDAKRALDYTKKDGVVVTVPEDFEFPCEGKGDAWGLVRDAETKEEALAVIAQEKPRDYIINRRNIDYALEQMFKPKVAEWKPMFERNSFTRVPAELDDWVFTNCDNPRPLRPKSIFIVSPSRFGKTEWARSLGPHAYIANQWDLSAFDCQPEGFWHNGYIVFDDVAWKTFEHSAKSFCGGQRDFSVTDKYRRKRRLVGGLPSIVLLNPDAPDFDDYKNFYNSDWGRANIFCCILILPLFQ